MTRLQDMPVVTVEQVMRFREAALQIEKQLDEVATAWERTMMAAIGEDGPVSVAKAIKALQDKLEHVRDIVDNDHLSDGIKVEEIYALLGPDSYPEPEPGDEICPDWTSTGCKNGCKKNCGIPF